MGSAVSVAVCSLLEGRGRKTRQRGHFRYPAKRTVGIEVLLERRPKVVLFSQGGVPIYSKRKADGTGRQGPILTNSPILPHEPTPIVVEEQVVIVLER